MSGAIPPLPQYAFMAWCLVKAKGQLYLLLYLTLKQPQSLRTTDQVLHTCNMHYQSDKVRPIAKISHPLNTDMSIHMLRKVGLNFVNCENSETWKM
jgi:hypothetical protein